MTSKEISAKHYRQRKDSGVCVRCGKERAPGNKTHCPECLEKVREYDRKTRLFYKSIGICPMCRKDKLFGEEKSCPECRAKRKKYSTFTEESKINNRRKQRELYKECIENGICTRCRKRKAVYNRKKCEICLEKDRVYQALRR